MLHLHLFWQTFWPALHGFLLQSSVYLALNSPTWDEKLGCVLGLRGVFFQGLYLLKIILYFIPEFCYPVSSIPLIHNIDLTFLPEKGAIWLTEVAGFFSLWDFPSNRTRARDHLRRAYSFPQEEHMVSSSATQVLGVHSTSTHERCAVWGWGRSGPFSGRGSTPSVHSFCRRGSHSCKKKHSGRWFDCKSQPSIRFMVEIFVLLSCLCI